jgi:hypothetical protein
MKTKPVVALLFCVALAGAVSAQQGPRRFGWIRANDETARLDPANYYGGRTYHPSAGGGNLHVDIQAQKPVTIFMAGAEEWSYALQHPEAMATIHEVCPRQASSRAHSFRRQVWLLSFSTWQSAGVASLAAVY